MFTAVLGLISRFRLLAALFSVLGIVASIYYHGISVERGKQAKVELAGVEINEKVSKDVMGLSDSELDKRLLKWRRD